MFMQRLMEKNKECILSYLTLRKLIGILGILLPVACLVGESLLQHVPVRESISSYYHSSVRDIFVGIIIGFSMFLLTYKGYEFRDTLMAIACGITGVGVALFPCYDASLTAPGVGVFQLTPQITGYIHYGSSCTFFFLLGINSFFLFTLGDETNWTKSKSKRNVIYRICGLAIFASLATLGILTLTLGQEQLGRTVLTFIFETLMLLAFGTSWLVKGETFLRDKDDEPRFALAGYKRSGKTA